MSVKKTIQVNPDFLSILVQKKKSSKNSKIKPSFKPNNIKNKLLAKIKNIKKKETDKKQLKK